MNDLLIIAHFTQVPGEPGNNRFNYIAEKMDKADYKVEIVTSSFSHKTKSQRNVLDRQLKNISYKLTMLYEPGYQKNVSLKRFYSHYIMGKNLKQYLKMRNKPDVIYCAIPSIDVAYIAAYYAKKNNIKFVIDVQDLWPESFKLIFDVPVISDVLFYPMIRKANFCYATADEIVAVSKTYVKRAISVNEKCKKGHSVFLGTELAYFDKCAEENKLVTKPEDELWLAYIGTLGHSYDLKCVIDGLKIAKDKCNLKFVVMGDGPLKSSFENYAKEQEVYAEFTGRLDYAKMVGLLTACDIAVNPISQRASASIINKVGDYAAAALPVLNTQECPEYRDLVDEYQMGLNCENNNAQDLSEKLLVICKDEGLRRSMGKNSRRLAEERFDREKTYQKIVALLKSG